MRPYYQNAHGVLWQGDCLAVMGYLQIEYGARFADMVLCDPPYGTTRNKWDAVVSLEKMWPRTWACSGPGAAVVFTAAQPFTSTLGASQIDYLRYSWVWEKSAATGHLNAKRMPMKNHEDVLIFYQEPPTYNPQGVAACNKVTRRGGNGGCYGASGKENVQDLTNYPRTIVAFRSEGRTVHPTQKPVALFAYLIQTYTNPGEVVLDFCAGSGTTAVAAEETGRRWVCIEKEEKYCELIAKRQEARKGGPA